MTGLDDDGGRCTDHEAGDPGSAAMDEAGLTEATPGMTTPGMTTPGTTTLGVAARGRGAATLNPGNRFETVRLHVLGDHLDAQHAEHPDGVQVRTVTLPDHTRTIINKVAPSPDIHFKWTINPYRGCEHGCIYCYARPSHEMLGMSCGLDFETKILIKHDAAKLLRRELALPKWTGETIVISGITDCYQPLEATHRITRQILEVCAECRQPVSFITKNRLVTRDIDLLQELAKHNAVRVAISITTHDAKLAQIMEPRTSTPRDRFRAVRELSDAGIPTVVMVAPVIPSINDQHIPEVLRMASEAGAQSAGWVMLRLPWQIKDLFIDWLQRHFPDRAARVEHHIRAMRGGALNDPRFGHRMRGEGPHAETIKAMFDVYAKRYGLDQPLPPLSNAAFRKPSRDGQMGLFDGA